MSLKSENPPRNGEGDRQPKAGGGGAASDSARLREGAMSHGVATRRRPSTMLRMVPLPVPGRIWSLILGALSALGMAPLFWWPLTLFAVALLIVLLGQSRTARRAFALGWWFGAGHFLVGLNWIAKSFTYQAALPSWLGWGAVLLVAMAMAFYPALAAWAAWRMKGRRPGALILAFAGYWTLTEWLRATLFTGFGWNPLAETALPMHLGGIAAWVGSYGLSAVIVLIAGTMVLAFQRHWRAAAVTALIPAILAILTAIPPAPLSSNPSAGGTRVTLVQPDVGQDVKWESGSEDANFAKLARLTPPLDSTPRLILWTEAAIPDYLETGYPASYYRIPPDRARQRMAALMNRKDILLTGAVKLELDKAGSVTGARNSIFAMDATGKLIGRYDKAHLLPFGEYLPFRSILTPLGLSRFAPGSVDFLPGDGPRTLPLARFGKVGLVICYEMVFSGRIVDKANRPDFIFSPSNDAWFGAWGPPQHHAQARLRAIEEGLPVVRVTPTGISAIIDGFGTVRGDIPSGTSGRLDQALPPALAPTLFARFGNILPLLLSILLVAAALVVPRWVR